MQLFRCLSGVSSVLNYTLFYCNEAWGWALHQGELNFFISKSIQWQLSEATERHLNSACCASAAVKQTGFQIRAEL